MSDTLQIFGNNYSGVTGIKADDGNGNTLTFTRENLQSKTKSYTPSTSQQSETISPDTGYTGLSSVSVTVGAMPSGTAGTPTATKGTVSNHSISVTPKVTNTTGYITGSTKTGTAVTVSASELVSGNLPITANTQSTDVTNYATVSVNVSPNLQSKSKSYTPTSTQQTETITADNGYDGLSSVAITVAAASGGSNWTLLHEEDISANTTGTSAASLKSITGITGAWDESKIIYVRVRDKAGPRAGYFYGSDSFFINWQKANGSTTAPTTAGRIIHRYTSSNTWGEYVGATTTGYGVYGYDINSSGRVRIYQRYSSSYSLTINGTYRVQIYSLTYPDGKSPFNTGTITGTI